MRIKQLEYYNKTLEWKLEPVDFSDLTLLVGVSGVGKSQILKAIWNLRKIANGSSLNGLVWNITFLTRNNSEYRWQGEFESKEETEEPIYEEDRDDEFKIIYEKLFLDQRLIVDRDKSGIIFHGEITPKLSPYKSIIEILNQEDDIAPAYNDFGKIIRSARVRSENEVYRTPVMNFDELKEKYASLESIQESDLALQVKLVLVHKNDPETFNKIREDFINMFPQVEDLTIKPIREKLPTIFDSTSFLKIKEKNVHTWIDQTQMSSGMLRSIIHISEIYLWPAGTVILIDEFENSLGVNCIDVLTENLLGQNRNLQFIITSHHPYIINNIGMEHWKIVTRNGGVVTVKDAKDFNLGKSRHDAFIQLINLESFKEGIAS